MICRAHCRSLNGAVWLSTLVLVTAAAGAVQSPEVVDPLQATAGPADESPSILPTETEDALLRQALAYLGLSRGQAGYLLLPARQVADRFALLRQEEAETAGVLAELARHAPEAAAQLRLEIAARRGAAATQVARFAANRLVRLLSREQIGLAWRLMVGRPPEYAQADPALLERAAGFVSERDGKPPFPFPQRLAESMDADELAGVIEPFSRRLFTSARFMPVLQGASRRGPAPARAPVGNAGTPVRSLRLLRDYRLDHDLGDRSHHGPDLEPLGGRLARGLYEFHAGEGLRVADLGVTDHYALQVDFRCQEVDGRISGSGETVEGAVPGASRAAPGHAGRASQNPGSRSGFRLRSMGEGSRAGDAGGPRGAGGFSSRARTGATEESPR